MLFNNRRQVIGLQVVERSIKFFEKTNSRWRENNTDPISYSVQRGNQYVPYASCDFVRYPKSPRLSASIRLARMNEDESLLALPRQKDELRRWVAKVLSQLRTDRKLKWRRIKHETEGNHGWISESFTYDARDRDNGIFYSFHFDEYGCPTVYDICFTVEIDLSHSSNGSIGSSFDDYLKKRKPIRERF